MTLLAILGAIYLLVGCDSPVTPEGAARRFENKKLTLRCPDSAFADAIAPMVKGWEVRTGAKVVLVREVMTPADESDLAILPTGDLGAWAEPGLLTPVPLNLRASDNPFQWFGLLPAYGERLVEWGGQTMAVPLTGDGFVIVYRADRFADNTAQAEFRKQHSRAPAAPATWEEFAELAEFFAKLDKKPSLPPLPGDAAQRFDLFCRVASSADRRALNDVQVANRAGRDLNALAFQDTVTTGEPRLTTFGFKQAADWLARLQAARAVADVPPGGSDDPVAALDGNQAVLALLSLDQLSRLPRENGVVAARFAIASVPGTRTYFNQGAGKEVRNDPNPNYVPYFAGGRLGVVRSRCTNPEAAFDLLAELGSPARGTELVATPGLGAGPIRTSHLDRDRLIVWLGYGFDEARSKALQDALRRYVGQTVKNPTFELRGPDRAAVIAAVAEPLKKIGAGLKPDEALNQADAAWKALNAKVPQDKLITWRRHAAGLD